MIPPKTPLEAFIRSNLGDVVFGCLGVIVLIEIMLAFAIYYWLTGELPPAHPF